MSIGDGDEASLVRSYVVTQGRARPSAELRVDSTVVTTGRVLPDDIRTHHARVLQLCEHPQSVAELAARMQLPVRDVKVLVSDLLAHGALAARPAHPSCEADPTNVAFLERVLDGLLAM